MSSATTQEQEHPSVSDSLVYSLAHFPKTELSLVRDGRVGLSADLFKGSSPRSAIEIIQMLTAMLETNNLKLDESVYIVFTLNTLYQLLNSVLNRVEALQPSADVLRPEYRITIEDEEVVVSVPRSDLVVTVSTPIKTKSGDYKDAKKILNHIRKKLLKNGIVDPSIVSLERIKVLLSAVHKS